MRVKLWADPGEGSLPNLAEKQQATAHSAYTGTCDPFQPESENSPVILVLGRLRQEDCKCEANLGYKASPRTDWGYMWRPCFRAKQRSYTHL